MTSKELHGQKLSRPRSAVESNRFASQSLGRFFQQQNSAMDEQTVSTIWKGFGSYVAKQLRNGKGISIPKFGNFTFTAPLVDLAGTTNPNDRDKQNRDPVFLVGKDFVSGVELRTGMAHNGGAQVRPYDVKGASGIIPKVKINYTEVACLCSQNKDICRNACEQVFRFLSDKVRKGEAVSMDIPYVGQFIVRGSICAVSFASDIVSETKGVTAKGHLVNKLFASSVNQLNLKIGDNNQIKTNPAIGLGGAVRLTGDAESWLKNNLNISVQEILSRPYDSRKSQRIQSAKSQGMLNRYASMKPEDMRNKSWALNGNGLTSENKAAFDRLSETKSGPLSKRPMSAVSRVTSNSRITNVPDIGRMKLMIIANDVYKNRSAITETLQQIRTSMRDTVSSSEICQILKKTGIYIEIGNIKALLKELGFNWNGPACSFYDLFQATKQYIYGQTQDEENKNTYFSSVGSPKYEDNHNSGSFNYNKIPGTASQSIRTPEQIIAIIKDLFYSTRKSIYEIYQEAKLGQMIDSEGLRKVVQLYSQNQISQSDIQTVFNHIAKGKREMTYQTFETTFKWELLAGGDWETRTVRNIREWMFKNNLSSETTFDMFLKHAGKVVQKRLTRVDFHKALSLCNLTFSAPEIDGLFYLLDLNQDGELELDEWRSRIYEDSHNPLQMLREVVTNNRLTSDDLLYKMQLRIWDAPLDFPKLVECLRRLDPTLSEPQLRHLAKSLKNKDNKVDVTALLRNLCGQEHETVDFRNKIFREIYAEVHPNKEDQLQQLLEDADPLNDGRVEPQGLKVALKKIVRKIDDDSIDRFIRFLDKDQSGKINYMDFLAHMSEVSNRDHNPFKSVVQRLQYFISSNKQTVHQILKRLAVKKTNEGPERDAIPTDLFAQFLKAKIDKKRDMDSLRRYAHFMDVDKDGYITEIDIQTCLSNLNSDAFFKNNGEALASSAFASAKKFFPSAGQLSEERLIELMKQIRQALIGQKIAYREAFNRFDENKDNFLSFGEFSNGIDKVLTLSVPIKEKLFAFMDKNQIGLIDYPNFLEVIQLSSANTKKNAYDDNFDWENGVIDKIRDWISRERITVEEVFKCFDIDFDGYISKDDLKQGLVSILEIKADAILPTKLERLMKLMDFYKTGKIQLSDFQRIINNDNPYQTTGSRGSQSTVNFRKSCGGGFLQTSTFDWKLSAIQQVGLHLSKNYSSLAVSFETISEHLQKISFEQFKKFIEKSNCLQGFNMTLALIQKLFSDLDPHKKGYLSEQDWVNAFQSFKWNDQIFIELKNAIQCSFADVDSAFDFFLTFKTNQQSTVKVLSFVEFEKAVNSLTSNRFKQAEVQSLWKSMVEGKTQIDKYQFRIHFDNLKYSGHSTVRNLKSAPPGARTTIQTQSSSSTQWEQDIIEKLRQIIRSSSKSFEDIFREFDEDGNGTISQNEFRNSIRRLNLGLSSREIDKIMEKIDTNNDGKIDYKEFITKFKTNSLDERLKERAKDKMARLKELMILHMTSPNDAFRFFDESKLGKLTYQEFSKLVIKCHELAGDKVPTYPVIKDLFDTIDIRKDGILDMNEWQQTFGNVIEGSQKLSIKATPLNMWENSREFLILGSMIAKNRKMLRENFDKVSGGKGHIVNFEQVKVAMDEFLNLHFKGLSDEKLKCALRPSEIQSQAASNPGSSYDYVRLLDIYKSRHAGSQM